MDDATLLRKAELFQALDPDEMARTFNMGIGMAVVVPGRDAFKALDVLRAAGHRAAQIGEIRSGEGRTRLV